MNIYLRCGYRISIKGNVRPSVGPSVGPSVCPLVRNAVVKIAKPIEKSLYLVTCTRLYNTLCRSVRPSHLFISLLPLSNRTRDSEIAVYTALFACLLHVHTSISPSIHYSVHLTIILSILLSIHLSVCNHFVNIAKSIAKSSEINCKLIVQSN